MKKDIRVTLSSMANDFLNSSKTLHHYIIIVASSLVALINGSNVQTFGMKSAFFDILPIFVDRWRHEWLNISHICYSLNILKMYYDFITIKSSVITLVTSDITHSVLEALFSHFYCNQIAYAWLILQMDKVKERRKVVVSISKQNHC